MCAYVQASSHAKNLRHFFFFLIVGARTEKWMYFVVLAGFNADLYVKLSTGSGVVVYESKSHCVGDS